jgi:hypothetical protein
VVCWALCISKLRGICPGRWSADRIDGASALCLCVSVLELIPNSRKCLSVPSLSYTSPFDPFIFLRKVRWFVRSEEYMVWWFATVARQQTQQKANTAFLYMLFFFFFFFFFCDEVTSTEGAPGIERIFTTANLGRFAAIKIGFRVPVGDLCGFFDSL